MQKNKKSQQISVSTVSTLSLADSDLNGETVQMKVFCKHLILKKSVKISINVKNQDVPVIV